MKIYLVSQNVNNDYDTYDSFVCIASSENEARQTHPHKSAVWNGSYWVHSMWGSEWDIWEWCLPSQVEVEYIGESKEELPRVILASFNAG